MELSILDSSGQELSQKELHHLNIWNPSMDRACSRILGIVSQVREEASNQP